MVRVSKVSRDTVRPSQQERSTRALGRQQMPWRMLGSAALFVAFVAAFIIAGTASRDPDLSYVNVSALSGSESGNYHAIVAKVAAEARRRGGRIGNLASAGSIENMTRLAAAKRACTIQFALVQDGLPWPEPHPFELIGHLPAPEFFVVLGRQADRIKSIADLKGLRVGIGPVGSGTEYVARQLMDQLAELDIRLTTHPLDEQLAMLQRGDLDLGAMVMEPDAALLQRAVRDLKLQIVDIAGADALAHRLRSARAGVIKAGYYDPVRNLPPTDKRVIEINTLVIGNGCTRESVTQGVITAFVRVFPDFMRVNREQANVTGLQYASAAQSYFDDQGPDRVGEYLPWVIDIMPWARWLQLIFAFSVLFGAQALWHRFRVSRLDARRVRIESAVESLLGRGITVGEIEAMTPDARHRSHEVSTRVDSLIRELDALAHKCRRQSQSMVVPMGQEMYYRYQESLIADLLYALRSFRAKLG